MNNLQHNPEEATKVIRKESLRPSNVIPFPVRKIQKQTHSILDDLTDTQLEASKMMGEIPAMNEEEKQAHIARVNAERQGANECVVLIMNLA